MFKKIFCLVMFLFMSLMLVQGIREAFLNRILYPVVFYNIENSDNPKRILSAAKLKFYTCHFDEAKTLVVKALKQPDIKNDNKLCSEAYLYLGHTFYEEYDFNNALKAYYLTLKNNPTNKDALRKAVRIYMATEKAQDAIPLINHYLVEKKEDPFALTERCAVYTRLGKYLDAGRDCEAALKKRKGYARAQYDYAVVLEKLKFNDKAQDYFRQVKLHASNIESREEIETKMLNAGKESS